MEDDENVNEKEIYRPTGPDGKGWGEFRQLTEEDIQMFEELKKEDDRKANRKSHLLSAGGYIADGDENVNLKIIFFSNMFFLSVRK